MAYLLDANVFMQAKNLHYGLDFCPAFWDWLVAQNKAGNLFSIEKVEDEIHAGNDELLIWAKACGSGFFLQPDSAMLGVLGRVSKWAVSQYYDQAAISTFMQLADYYLVSHALAHNHIVVTHEIPAATSKKVKIPNACVGLGIKCMTPFEMLRIERARFVLGNG